MDGKRFDAWTRRRFGVAVGGGVAALLGLSALDPDAAAARAGQRAGKSRCVKTQGADCGGKKKCCRKKGLSCQPPLDDPEGQPRCCRRGGESCATTDECCSGGCMDNQCTCKSNGQPCAIDGNCCSLHCATGPSGSSCQRR